jgi:hypothetical protein
MALFAASFLWLCKWLAIMSFVTMLGLAAHSLYVVRFNRRIDQRHRDWLSQAKAQVHTYCENNAHNEYQYESLDNTPELQPIRLIEL